MAALTFVSDDSITSVISVWISIAFLKIQFEICLVPDMTIFYTNPDILYSVMQLWTL